MNVKKSSLLGISMTLLLYGYVQAGQYDRAFDKVIEETDTVELQSISQRTNKEFQFLMKLADLKKWDKQLYNKEGEVVATLASFNLVEGAYTPIYKQLYNNGGVGVGGIANGGSIVSGNVDLYGGGALGLNLSGAGLDIALWDAGSVQPNHQEFIGRLTNNDAVPAHSHSTHVAGTMAAEGVVAAARGMSFDANVQSFDWDNDLTEMAAEAAGGLLVSNHSYGQLSGWVYNFPALTEWFWAGGIQLDEDYSFGYYSQQDQTLDEIMYNAPYYTSVWASGNSHYFSPYNFVGFGSDTPYWTYDLLAGVIVAGGVIGSQAAPAKDKQIGDFGYTTQMAKNTVSVANVDYEDMLSIVKYTTSSPGGQNEWRIKPDIATKGWEVYSSNTPGVASYSIKGGTSMASPLVAGSFLLWQEHYFNLNTAFMRSSTVKALAITGADDFGNAGPDYHFGWGLLNSNSSADLITNDGVSSLILEDDLGNATFNDLMVQSNGVDPIKVTLVWTDVAGQVHPDNTLMEMTNILEDPTLKLVNDLDLRLTHSGGAIYEPYVMDTSDPLNPFAITGDNIIDNVEQILLAAPPAGSYTISVSHKDALVDAPQSYSIVAAGVSPVVGAADYCPSNGNITGAYISHVSLFNLIPNNITGDDGGYGNYITQVAALTPGTSYPLRLRAFYNGPVETVYWRGWIDYNANNVFEASEMLGQITSNGIGRVTFDFEVPAWAVSGSDVRLRVSASLTDYVGPCGTFNSGEVEDYSVHIN